MNSNNAVRDYLDRSSIYRSTGLVPRGNGSTGSLPVSDFTADDRGAVPWHPDSPMFWVAAIGTLVIVGIVGFSGTGRIGPVKAQFKAGK